MTAAPTSILGTAFFSELTTVEVYREFRDPAMILYRTIEGDFKSHPS